MASEFFMPIKRLTLGISVVCLLAASTTALGEPAPWYWWVSLLDGTRVCNQTPLGEGWAQEPTPFKDARCRIPLPR